MIALAIHGATRRLGAPKGVGSDDCSQLAIRDIPSPLGNQMWSAWELTPSELELLNAGARIYLIITGAHHPMVCLAVGTHIDGDPLPEEAP